MTEQQDLQNRIDKLKQYMTEDNNTPPTDKEVLEELKTISEKNMEDALADDMEGFVIAYQKRIKLINEKLEAIHVNEQAEINKAVNRYEQGLGID